MIILGFGSGLYPGISGDGVPEGWDVNTSVQVGDLAFYVNLNANGGFSGNFETDQFGDLSSSGLLPSQADPLAPVYMGIVQEIVTDVQSNPIYTESSPEVVGIAGGLINWQEGVEMNNSSFVVKVNNSGLIVNFPTSSSFIFFAKNNLPNMSTISGYYSEIEFKNNSKVKAELYAASCEMSESSK